jgi:hypothetical protein
MSAIDMISAGEPLPLIADVTAATPYSVLVTWQSGARAGLVEMVDLAPHILTYKLYRPLRENRELFATVRVIADGAAIGWGRDEEIDMPATAVERLATDVMSNDDFAGFLTRNNLSLDAAAAQLGISRRLVAYYAKNRPIPRYIALACRYLESLRQGYIVGMGDHIAA